MFSVIKMMYWKISAVLNFFKAKGLLLVARLSGFEMYQPLPWIGIKLSAIKSAQHGTLERWQMIEQELPTQPCSVLDIGCNIGFFSIMAAIKGHFVIGVESYGLACEIAAACAKAIQCTNVNFYHKMVTPQNIESLPACDVVLLLSVFHHWCRSYGTECALTMLQQVANRTKLKLFFETAAPTEPDFKDVLPNMDEIPELWWIAQFRSMGFKEVRILGKSRGRDLIMGVK